jgi:hypothetical protein
MAVCHSDWRCGVSEHPLLGILQSVWWWESGGAVGEVEGFVGGRGRRGRFAVSVKGFALYGSTGAKARYHRVR